MPEETTQSEMKQEAPQEPKAAPEPATRSQTVKAESSPAVKKESASKASESAASKPATKKSTSKKSVSKKSTSKSGDYVMTTKSTAYKKLEASFEPVMEFNKMIAGSMESSYNMMMDSFQSYSKLGIDNMQSALKVRSPEDMVSYFESQHAMAQKASDMMMSDAKSMSDMSIKFFNDVRGLYESGVKTSMTAATEAMKAA